LAVFIALVGTQAVAVEPPAIPCNIADDLAGKAYDRAASAKNQHNEVVAYQAKLAFWDIYQYSSGCDNVNAMARELTRNKLGENDGPPTNQATVESLLSMTGFGRSTGCFSSGTGDCQIVVYKPAKGNAAGMEGKQTFYWLNEDSLSRKSPDPTSWKMFTGSKLVLPQTDIDLRK
jgi:hypothetical protein